MRSLSLSSTTSPTSMTMRNSMRFRTRPRRFVRPSPFGFQPGKIYRIGGPAEFDNRAVAGALDDVAALGRDGRVDEVASKAPQARARPLLVGAGEPAIADDVGHRDRRELLGLAHCASPAVDGLMQIPA